MRLHLRCRPSVAAVVALSAATLLTIAPSVGARSDSRRPVTLGNSGFDRGLAGWRGHRASLQLVPGGKDGRAVRVAGKPGRKSTFALYAWPRPVSSTFAGAVYQASAWVKGARGHRLCLRVREIAGVNRTVASTRRCMTANGRWQRLHPLGYRARRSGSRLGLSLRMGAAETERAFRADRIILSETKPAMTTSTTSDARTGEPGVGVHSHMLWGTYDNAQRLAVIDRMAAAGLDWLRVDISWCSFEGTRGELNPYWTNLLDVVVDQARAKGLSVLGNVICTPAWATACPSCSWDAASALPPTDPALFGAFMRVMAERYRGRIAAWEVWNEPNEFNHQFWRGDAAAYVHLLLRPGYTAVKEADPAAKVVTGGTSYADVEWVRGLYAAGASGLFDALGVHPYMAPWNLPPETDNGTKWTISGADAVRAEMLRNGDERPIWFTEMGWSSSLPAYPQGVTEEQQADYTVRAIKLVTERFPYVENLFFYNDRDRTSGHPRENGFGLLRNDLSPKPVYGALAALLTA